MTTRLSLSRRSRDKFLRREDKPARGEEPLNKTIMKLYVQIRAAIAYDGNTIIGVSGLEKSGKDDAARRDSVKNQRIDVIGAEDHREIGASEGTDPALGDNDLILLRSDCIRDRSKGFTKELLMLLQGLNGAEERISGADFREARSKTDLDVNDCHAAGASMLENTFGSNQKGVFALSGV
jgi:hypothetical protein